MLKLLALLMLLSTSAKAFTPCSVTDWISILQVSITGSPVPVLNAQYDLETGYLWVLLNNNTAHFFVNVPVSLAQGVPPFGTTPWAILSAYEESLEQQGTWCPIQLSTSKPLLSR